MDRRLPPLNDNSSTANSSNQGSPQSSLLRGHASGNNSTESTPLTTESTQACIATSLENFELPVEESLLFFNHANNYNVNPLSTTVTSSAQYQADHFSVQTRMELNALPRDHGRVLLDSSQSLSLGDNGPQLVNMNLVDTNSASSDTSDVYVAVCPSPGCGRTYRSNAALRTHLRRNHRERYMLSSSRERRFSDSSKWKRNQQSKGGNNSNSGTSSPQMISSPRVNTNTKKYNSFATAQQPLAANPSLVSRTYASMGPVPTALPHSNYTATASGAMLSSISTPQQNSPTMPGVGDLFQQQRAVSHRLISSAHQPTIPNTMTGRVSRSPSISAMSCGNSGGADTIEQYQSPPISGTNTSPLPQHILATSSDNTVLIRRRSASDMLMRPPSDPVSVDVLYIRLRQELEIEETYGVVLSTQGFQPPPPTAHDNIQPQRPSLLSMDAIATAVGNMVVRHTDSSGSSPQTSFQPSPLSFGSTYNLSNSSVVSSTRSASNNSAQSTSLTTTATSSTSQPNTASIISGTQSFISSSQLPMTETDHLTALVTSLTDEELMELINSRVL